MKIVDKIKLSSLLIFRERKKIFYIFLVFLISLLCLFTLSFNDNVGELILKYLNNNINFRTIKVMQRTNHNGMTGQESLLNDISEIKKMEHIIDVYKSGYGEAIIFESDFKNDSLDGTITLKRATEKTLPTVIYGRKIKDNEEGVMICPINFFPNSNPMEITKKYIINGKNLLNNKYKVYYYSYILNENKRPIENELFNYEFEVIGLYDNTETLNDNNDCYISAKDLNRIVDTQEIEDEVDDRITIDYSIDVVVDSINNITATEDKLINNGFDVSGTVAHFDIKTIKFIRIIIILMLFVSISMSIIISTLYIKKKLIKEEKTIAIFRTSGYLKQETGLIYTLQTLILNIIIYIVAIVVFNILKYVLINNIPFLTGIDYLMGKIQIKQLPYLITFIIVVIIPSIITLFNVNNKYKCNISKLIKKEK